MNEIIDFLKKEDTPIVKKMFTKKKNIVTKDLTVKIDIAKKHEDQLIEKQKSLISVKIKPLKELKRKNETIWL